MKKWLSVFVVMLAILIPSVAIPDPTVNKNQIGEYYTYGVLQEPLPETVIVKRGELTIQGDTAYLYLEHVSFDKLWENFNALRPFKVKRIVLELFSFGGSLFDAIAMSSIMAEQEASGKIIEVRGRGIIASAGLILLISGTRGHRFLHPTSIVMFHELQSFKIFAVETPTDKEDEARIYRFIQNNVNRLIVSRSKISMQELKDRIEKKELWLDASGAIKYGFADKLLGN